MTEPVILSYRDVSDDTVEITFGTKDFGQAVCRVRREAISDPGTLVMLKALYDRQRSIRTMPRRSANPNK